MGLGSSVQIPAADISEKMADIVNKRIKDNKVMIFSKSFCPYCKIAKKAFEELKVQYEVMELDGHPNGSEIQNVLREMTGASSVPRVFVGGKCIGGGTETKDLLKSGELKRLVDQCE